MTSPQVREYDVAISGASIAGCTAAVLLARAGARVALLERRSSPEAHKVLCTHYLQPCAYQVLDDLGVSPLLREAGALANQPRWYTRWGWIEPRPGRDGVPLAHGYNVRRSTLDPLLRSYAADRPGVDLLSGHTVTALLRDGSRAAGVRTSSAEGEQEIRARLVVGADGKDSTVARLAGVRERAHRNDRFSYFAHFRGVRMAREESHCWFLDPDVAYAMPNDDGITVIAIIPDKKRLPAFRADLEGSFLDFVGRLPEAPDLSAAERVSKIVGTTNYPLVSRQVTAPGVALIGDAALTGDPLWGVGCGWALQSAQWLATSARAAAVSGSRAAMDLALDTYRRRHRRQLRGHQFLAADYAKARPFNPFERLMFSAAARDASMARHMHLFASRLIGPARFLSPTALGRAAAVNLRHRSA
ncbi:NAD(P)/FAD-dependent oxidoreductase [Streptomyces sp. NPDC059008]|uniref:NAD(P)/FAD-dependent oxidoreductase n=1 Tax=unclassified Streptomyces TaxID=2593676 RepID=UPI0036A44E6E